MTTCNIIILLEALILVALAIWCLHLDSQNDDMRGYIKRIDGDLEPFQKARDEPFQ